MKPRGTRGPDSLALRCGRWSFTWVQSDPGTFLSDTQIFEFRWRTRGGELGYIARRAVSNEELTHANCDLEEWVWTELEKAILIRMEA